MTTQVLFSDAFFEKDPYLNAVETMLQQGYFNSQYLPPRYLQNFQNFLTMLFYHFLNLFKSPLQDLIF